MLNYMLCEILEIDIFRAEVAQICQFFDFRQNFY